MSILLSIITIGILGILALQDFRHRAISWFLLPLLLIAFILTGLQQNDLSQLGIYFGVNFSFILLQVALLTVYFSLKNKKITNIVNEYIGVGDLLFFVVICAAFSPVNFILFYVACLVLALVFVIVQRMMVTNANREIPLAGLFSVVLVFSMISTYINPMARFYDDGFLMALVNIN